MLLSVPTAPRAAQLHPNGGQVRFRPLTCTSPRAAQPPPNGGQFDGHDPPRGPACGRDCLAAGRHGRHIFPGGALKHVEICPARFDFTPPLMIMTSLIIAEAESTVALSGSAACCWMAQAGRPRGDGRQASVCVYEEHCAAWPRSLALGTHDEGPLWPSRAALPGGQQVVFARLGLDVRVTLPQRQLPAPCQRTPPARGQHMVSVGPAHGQCTAGTAAAPNTLPAHSSLGRRDCSPGSHGNGHHLLSPFPCVLVQGALSTTQPKEAAMLAPAPYRRAATRRDSSRKTS